MSSKGTTKKPRKGTNKSAAQAATVASLSAGIIPPVNSDDIAGSLVQHHIAIPVDQSQGKDKNEVPDEPFDLQTLLEALSAATDGEHFFKILLSLPVDNAVYGQAQVINRATDVILARQPELLPPGNNKYRWGKISVNDMKTLGHAYFKIKEGELLDAMIVAAVHVKHPTNIPDFKPVREARLKINQNALVAHVMVDPNILKLITEYTTKIHPTGKISIFTDGVKNYRAAIMDQIAEYANEHAASYHNLLKLQYMEVKAINPQVAQFKNGEEFRAQYVEIKNRMDRLNANLIKSGRNEAGVIEDATALKFSGFSKTMINPVNFYIYMVWKGKDLRYLTNELPKAIQISAGYDADDDNLPNSEEYHKEIEEFKTQIHDGLQSPNGTSSTADAAAAVLGAAAAACCAAVPSSSMLSLLPACCWYIEK